MSLFKRLLIVSMFSLFVLLPLQGRVAMSSELTEGYADPTFRDLSQTLMRMSLQNLIKDEVMDEYAEIFYCDLWRENYSDDFQWGRIRKSIREDIRQRQESFRVFYEVVGSVKLGRYDFEGETFPLTDATKLSKVGALYIYEADDFDPYCDRKHESTMFPFIYLLQLNAPISILSLDMQASAAEVLIKEMQKVEENNRQLYIRFRVEVEGLSSVGQQGGALIRNVVNLRGNVIRYDFFLDRKKTQLVAEGREF